jgi:hypothetical protein
MKELGQWSLANCYKYEFCWLLFMSCNTVYHETIIVWLMQMVSCLFLWFFQVILFFFSSSATMQLGKWGLQLLIREKPHTKFTMMVFRWYEYKERFTKSEGWSQQLVGFLSPEGFGSCSHKWNWKGDCSCWYHKIANCLKFHWLD